MLLLLRILASLWVVRTRIVTSKPQMNEASGAGWRTVSSVRAGLWSFARLWKVHLATGSHASQLFINILSFLMRNARKRDAATSWWIPQLAASGFLLSFLGAYLEVCPREELVGGSSRGRTAAFSKDRLVGRHLPMHLLFVHSVECLVRTPSGR